MNTFFSKEVVFLHGKIVLRIKRRIIKLIAKCSMYQLALISTSIVCVVLFLCLFLKIYFILIWLTLKQEIKSIFRFDW